MKVNKFIDFLGYEFYSLTESSFELLEQDFDSYLGLNEDQDPLQITQPWYNRHYNEYESSRIPKIRSYIENKVIPLAKEGQNEFKDTVFKVLKKVQGSQQLFDIKRTENIIDKMNRGIDLKVMNDILRGAVITDDKESQEAVVKELKERAEVVYYSYKEFGTYKHTGYYGGHHLVIKLSNSVYQELQVMPKMLWIQKEMQHKFYQKSRLKILKDPNYVKTPEYEEGRKQSHKLFKFGNGEYKYYHSSFRR